MSFIKIIKDGQPVRKEDKKDGKLKFKYKIRCYDTQGREINRHVLAVNDREAERVEQELRADDSIREMRWLQAAEIFCHEHAHIRTEGYLKTVKKAAMDLVEVLGNKLLEETSAQDLARYFQSIRQTPRKANLQRSALLSVGRYLKRSFRVSGIPFLDAPKVEYTPERRLPFTLEELTTHYEVLDPAVKPVFQFLALSGCRVTAACLLKEEDIISGVITLQEKGMKGQKKLRQVIVDEYLQKALEEARAWKTSKGYQSEYVFLNSKGNSWTATALGHNTQKSWRKAGLILKELGRSHVLHELRHGYGTLAGQMNFEPDMIAASLGHASRHTSEIYTHHDASMALEAGKVIRPKIAEKLGMSHAS